MFSFLSFTPLCLGDLLFCSRDFLQVYVKDTQVPPTPVSYLSLAHLPAPETTSSNYVAANLNLWLALQSPAIPYFLYHC